MKPRRSTRALLRALTVAAPLLAAPAPLAAAPIPPTVICVTSQHHTRVVTDDVVLARYLAGGATMGACRSGGRK